MEKKQLEETAAFIRENRSNESNFSTLYTRLEEAAKSGDERYKAALLEIKEKQAESYRTATENGGAAWPEFEKFVSHFETAVIDAIKRA